MRTLAAWAGSEGDEAFRLTPASNVVFVRTAEPPPDAQFRAWAAGCWPVHNLVLETTGARRIQVGGTTELIRAALGQFVPQL